jgi:SAM-dependent methyltransferase
MAKQKIKAVAAPQVLRLDLGCGPNKRGPEWTGVDALPFDGKVDVVCDLRKPWTWADESVDEVHCSHFLEHLTGFERVHFFNELYRVLRKGEKATIIVPHWSSERAYGDPTHQWPPVVGFSFYYLNKAWRDQNAPHTGFTCDFDFSGGNSIAQPWNSRNQETQMFAQNHYINVAQDMWATVTKRG